MKNQRTIKRSVIFWQTILLLTVCFTINCYSGPGGDMHAQPGEGYTVVKTEDDMNAAQIVFGEIIVQITGSWSEKRNDNNYVIENKSDKPFSLDFAQIKSEVQGEPSAVTSIFAITDFSNYDNKAFDGAKNAKKIYEEYNDYDKGRVKVGTKKVTCAPKKKCVFGVYQYVSEKLNRDKSVKLTLPAMTGETRETVVVFNLRRNSIWDSLTAKIN